MLREHAPDGEKFDAFVKQWFFEVVVPEYRITEASRTKVGEGWEVRAKVKKEGRGPMPHAIALAKGDRMDKEGKRSPSTRTPGSR